MDRENPLAGFSPLPNWAYESNEFVPVYGYPIGLEEALRDKDSARALGLIDHHLHRHELAAQTMELLRPGGPQGDELALEIGKRLYFFGSNARLQWLFSFYRSIDKVALRAMLQQYWTGVYLNETGPVNLRRETAINIHERAGYVSNGVLQADEVLYVWQGTRGIHPLTNNSWRATSWTTNPDYAARYGATMIWQAQIYGRLILARYNYFDEAVLDPAELTNIEVAE